MCRALHISEQGHYRFLRRPERGEGDRWLLEQIYDCLREDLENGENYGGRRIIGWLRLHRGYTGGSRRLYRICREHNLTIRRQRHPNGLTKADRQAEKEGAIVHSDRGSQFTSQPFRTALARHKLVQSMSGAGRCYDNARTESFFATLKKEKLYPMDTTRLRRDAVQSAVFRYICYYNLRRISSVTGGLPPLVFRRNFYAARPRQAA